VSDAFELHTMKPFDKASDDEILRELRRALKELPDAPLALRRAAIGLWPAAAPGAELRANALELLKRVMAVLSFDSWAVPAAALGMRSLRVPTRHLLYSAKGRDIDLRVMPAAGAFSIAGQILGPDDTGSVELMAQGTPVGPTHLAQLDSLGEFRIDGVQPGVYVLTLRMGADKIVLPPVDVGEQRN
jgi:hypothetical protein